MGARCGYRGALNAKAQVLCLHDDKKEGKLIFAKIPLH